jgi:hypothetical protein
VDPGTAGMTHPASWWAQLPEVSDRFDAASAAEGLSDLITPNIPSPLLRREAQIAAEVAVRHLSRPASPELAERAAKAIERLAATVDRLHERHTGEDSGTREANALCHALQGRWAEAAAQAEAFVGTQPLLKVFVRALRLERLDDALTARLLRAGQDPATAVRVGLAVGRHSWWPTWLLKIVCERALGGTLDQETITALDRCAYAELSPAQARMASRLLNGEAALIDTSAKRLEALGETEAAVQLRRGDLTAVALAARSLPR